MLGPGVSLLCVDDTGKGTRNDNSLDAGSILLDGLQDTSCADDGGVKKVFLDICDVEMEGRGSVNHCFQAVNLDSFIEGALLCYIFDNAELELGGWGVGVRLSDLVGFLLGANRGDDSMAVLE